MMRASLESVVRVLATESGQNGFPVIRLAVSISVLEKGHVRFFRNVYPAVAEFERKGNVQSFGPNRAFVGFPILIDVLEDDDFIIRSATRVDVRVGRGAADPQPA